MQGNPKRAVRTAEVRDLMTEHVFTLQPNDDLEALYDLMDTHHVRHVPVVDRDGDLVGLVTPARSRPQLPRRTGRAAPFDAAGDPPPAQGAGDHGD